MKLKGIVFIILAIGLMVGIFYVLNPGAKSDKPVPANSSQNVIEQQKAPASAKVFEMVIQNGQLISGQNILKVNQGDEINIKITSNESDEFHIHGYDKSLSLQPGIQSEQKFKADISGRFEFELEKSGTELGVLEVAPR